MFYARRIRGYKVSEKDDIMLLCLKRQQFMAAFSISFGEPNFSLKFCARYVKCSSCAFMQTFQLSCTLDEKEIEYKKTIIINR